MRDSVGLLSAEVIMDSPRLGKNTGSFDASCFSFLLKGAIFCIGKNNGFAVIAMDMNGPTFIHDRPWVFGGDGVEV